MRYYYDHNTNLPANPQTNFQYLCLLWLQSIFSKRRTPLIFNFVILLYEQSNANSFFMLLLIFNFFNELCEQYNPYNFYLFITFSFLMLLFEQFKILIFVLPLIFNLFKLFFDTLIRQDS